MISKPITAIEVARGYVALRECYIALKEAQRTHNSVRQYDLSQSTTNLTHALEDMKTRIASMVIQEAADEA